MSRLVTFLGVITAVAFAVAPELTQIDPHLARYVMLAGVAAAAAGKELDPRVLRQGLPVRGLFASRKTLKAVAVVALVGLLGMTAACSSSSVRGVAAGLSAGADGLRGEIADAVSAGEITQTEADALTPVIDELKSDADAVVVEAAGWDSMTRGERLAVAGDAIERIGGTLQKLSDRGIGIKSARGRARLDKYIREGRRAVAILRVIEAAIPRK
jgi:hypothetical protein